MEWFPYLAMAAVLVPLLVMGIGYLYVSRRQARSRRESDRRDAGSTSPEPNHDPGEDAS